MSQIVLSIDQPTQDIEHEDPIVTTSPPLSTSPILNAVTVVRIFRLAGHYVVVAGQYSHEGRFYYLNNWAENTETLPGIYQFQERLDKKRYGLPIRFPIASYLAKPRTVWKPIGLPVGLVEVETVVNLHYDLAKWVRQDSYPASGQPTKRYLIYTTMPQDQVLRPVDQKIPFTVFGEN